MSKANQFEEISARWLLRREEPGWCEQDQAELDAWLDADDEHKMAFWRLEHGWHKVDRLVALRGPAPHVSPDMERSQHRVRRTVLAATALAACLVLAIFLAPGNDWFARKTYTTEIGGHETLPLIDGSRIEMNTATTLRTAVNERTRKVWLEQGEAYFEVARDPSRPFVVYAGDRTVTVLGTKFSVRREGDRIEVDVVEGRVQVVDPSLKAQASPTILTRGDVAVAQGASTLVAAKSEKKVDDALSWRQGVLTFDQLTLADVADEFNRYNRKQLVIADPAIAGIRIGGSFEPKNLDAFVRLLQIAYHLKVTDNGNRVDISG